MQAWNGARREREHDRERSSSVVLLGKLSAIVRRGSLHRSDAEDGANGRVSVDSTSSKSGGVARWSIGTPQRDEAENDDSEEDEATGSDTLTLATGSSTAMTMWDPSASGNGTGTLLFYSARPLSAAALARPLSQEELARRARMETQLPDSFAAMHAGFAPSSDATEDKSEEEEGQVDNNQQETREEAERVASRTCYDGDVFDADEDDVARTSDDGADDGADALCPREADMPLLDFDADHLTASVRTLVHCIKSESLLSESGLPVATPTATVSNQDEDDDEDEDDVNSVHDLHDLLDNNNFHDCSPPPELDLQASDPQYLHRHRTHLLSCAGDDQLTTSVRRLVLQLKDDSDRARHPLAASHGIRRKAVKAKPLRRRGNSCPTAYDLIHGDVLSPLPDSPVPLSPQDAVDPHLLSRLQTRERKKSAFARLAPRVLETLHLRKKRKTYLFTDAELESIEGARWKIVELAFRFGGKHRSYLVQAINMFFPLLKYGRRGGAHTTRLHCNCCGTLQWQHKRGGLSDAVDLADVLQLLDGRQTAVFRKYGTSAELESCSFSVIFRDRTLDLETESSSHRDWLVSALRTLVSYARRQRQAEQQAIAERVILPLDDDDLSLELEVSPQAQEERAVPANCALRTVY